MCGVIVPLGGDKVEIKLNRTSYIETKERIIATHPEWPFTVTLDDYTYEGETRIANAASICYGKDEAKLGKALTSKLVHHHKHIDTLRFAYMTMKLDNVSTGAHVQLVRIAHFGLLVMSSRYVDIADRSNVLPVSLQKETEYFNLDEIGEEFDLPVPDISDGGTNEMDLDEFLKLQKLMYAALRKRGIPKEDARYINIDARATSMWFSANLQAWAHLFRLRLPKKVMPETRAVAQTMFAIAQDLYPLIFTDEFYQFCNNS